MICHLLRRACHQMVVTAAGMMPDGRHPRDVALLRVISDNAPVSQQWLASYLGINPSVMVKLIDGLEARGDVARDRRPDDRRSYALRTTPAGRTTLRKLATLARRADASFSAALSTTERRRLTSLLQAVLLPYFEPPPPDELADLLGFLLGHTCLRLEAFQDMRLSATGLSVRTFVALAVLAHSAPCSQQALAAGVLIGPAAAVELVDALEHLGTVRRSRSPSDRRRYALEVTPDGEALLARAKAVVSGAAAEFMSSISEHDRCDLLMLLAKLAGPGIAEMNGPTVALRAPADRAGLSSGF